MRRARSLALTPQSETLISVSTTSQGSRPCARTLALHRDLVRVLLGRLRREPSVKKVRDSTSAQYGLCVSMASGWRMVIECNGGLSVALALG